MASSLIPPGISSASPHLLRREAGLPSVQVRHELVLTFIIPPPEIELTVGITPPRIMSYLYFLLHQKLVTAVNRRGRLQD